MIRIVKSKFPWLLGLLCFLWALSLSAKEPPPLPSRADFQKRAQEHFERGRSFYAERQYGEALIEFETAYRIQPEPALRVNIGYALWGLGRIEEARREFRWFLRRTPEGPERQAALDALRTLTGEVDESGLSTPARHYVKGAVVLSGVGALTAVATGGLALGGELLGLDRNTRQDLSVVAGVSLSASAALALSGAIVVVAQRGHRAAPLQIFAGPTQIGLRASF